MFELAADSYRQLLAGLRPGVRGKDLASALAGRAAAAGYKPLSFITGWSTVNSRPVLFSGRIEAADLELALQPGNCLNVAGWVVNQDETMGVWVGDTVLVTETGMRRFHRSPVDQLEANILGG